MVTKTECRSCGSENIRPFLDLGHTPLADRLLTEAQLNEHEPVFPLEVAFCEDCSLVQILETVPPDVLFCEDYPYYSSFSPALLDHSRRNVQELVAARALDGNSLAMELASNDGYLLKNYVDVGVPVLGIDPAEGPVEQARKIGVTSINDFFTMELAKKLADEGKKADIIHGNNVLAHVADTNGFVAGIATVLKGNGVAVIEAPYVRDLIDHCEFDTIYHEHLCYFSVTALDSLFRRHGLYINEVKRLSIHGGSLRIYAEMEENRGQSVLKLMEEEQQQGLDKYDYYQSFSSRVEEIKTSLLEMLQGLKAQGKKIAAYGAAAKGSTLINYVGIGQDLVDFVVDRNVHKQGKYMPGKHYPIFPTETLIEERPDYVLLLSWNFADEILAQQKAYRDLGGKFILPVPTPRVV